MNKGKKFFVILFIIASTIAFVVQLANGVGAVQAYLVSLFIGVVACFAYIYIRVSIDVDERKKAEGKQAMMSCQKCGHIAPASFSCPKCGSIYTDKFYI